MDGVRLAQEMAPQLPRELDFINEGKNAERSAECFKDRKDIVVRQRYTVSPLLF